MMEINFWWKHSLQWYNKLTTVIIHVCLLKKNSLADYVYYICFFMFLLQLLGPKSQNRKDAGHTLCLHTTVWLATGDEKDHKLSYLIRSIFPNQIPLNYNCKDVTFIIHQGIEINGRFKIDRLLYVNKVHVFYGLILTSGNTQQ